MSVFLPKLSETKFSINSSALSATSPMPNGSGHANGRHANSNVQREIDDLLEEKKHMGQIGGKKRHSKTKKTSKGKKQKGGNIDLEQLGGKKTKKPHRKMARELPPAIRKRLDFGAFIQKESGEKGGPRMAMIISKYMGDTKGMSESQLDEVINKAKGKIMEDIKSGKLKEEFKKIDEEIVAKRAAKHQA